MGSGKSTTTGFIAEHLHNNGMAASTNRKAGDWDRYLVDITVFLHQRLHKG
jgi:hypothetical protein